MNVLMMTNTYAPHVGGVARSVASAVEWLRSPGHRVLVGAPRFPGAPDREPGVIRVPAIQQWNGSDFSLPLPVTRALHRAVRDLEPDLVHSHHPFLLGDTALRVARELELPVVFTHHTLYEHYTRYVSATSMQMRRFVQELATSYANLCDAVIAPSESIASLLRERGVHVRIKVVPTGVDLAGLGAGDGVRFRRAWSIPADAAVVGHVGRLAPEKNLAFLGKALAELARTTPSLHVLIVGAGPEDRRVRASFADRDLRQRLHMPGILEDGDLADAYRAMDVFAFASRTETQGLVLAEAMAAGVPVVAIDAPGVREVVIDRANGRLLAARQSVRAFAEAVTWVIRHRDRLSVGAERTARAFSREAAGRRALSLYTSLTRATRAPLSRPDSAWRDVRRRIHEEWILLGHRTRSIARALESQRPAR